MKRGEGLEGMTVKVGGERLGELFRTSRRQALALGAMIIAVLGTALYLRFFIIQNTPIGFACEAGEVSFICRLRLATITLFNLNVFSGVAIAAAAVQLCRPNIVAFGIGLVFAAFGLVLYSTRLSALAVALLVLSLARVVRAAP
jgi:hypothetical protein